MKKIFYDHQIFSTQNVGGISRYFFELKNQIPEYGFQPNDPTYISDNVFLKKKIPLPQFRGANRIKTKVNNLIDLCSTVVNRYDIIHPTYYFESSFLGVQSAKKVITVYDMIHEKFPHYFRDAKELSQQKYKLTSEADMVLAISHKTKEDLVKLFRIPEEKVKVVHLASSMTAQTEITPVATPEKFILFVGSRVNYKSFNEFIAAIAPVIQKHKFHVFCVGGGSFNPSEKEYLSGLGILDYFVQANLTDSQLAYAYKKALLFAFPSQYEGFGIPVLEAFEMSCPTILAKKSCLPEIGGDGAFYFNDFSELEELVEKMVIDPQFRTSKASQQRLRANDFSWNKTAKETARAYNGLFL